MKDEERNWGSLVNALTNSFGVVHVPEGWGGAATRRHRDSSDAFTTFIKHDCSAIFTKATTMATPSSSQIVTLPDIPELFDPNFLDILIPPSPKAAQIKTEHVQNNPMIDALQATAEQTRTANNAPAYSSTSSATLDAFQFLGTYHSKFEFEGYLQKSWEEDPELTLRIIWNIRSIHDGKANKECFYK